MINGLLNFAEHNAIILHHCDNDIIFKNLKNYLQRYNNIHDIFDMRVVENIDPQITKMNKYFKNWVPILSYGIHNGLNELLICINKI